MEANRDTLEIDWVGGTAIHAAASEGLPDSVELLLNEGANVDTPSAPGGAGFEGLETALCYAAKSGHLAIAALLLSRDALVDGLPSSAASPLLEAASKGHLEIARLLARAGSDLDWEGTLPATPLEQALRFRVANTGQDRVAEYLREQGAIRPYAEWHDWADPQVELIERNIGVVHQRPKSRVVSGAPLFVHRARFAPRKFLTQLLFTAGLRAPYELGMALPARWRLNKNALVEHRFSWPYELLFQIGERIASGATLSHGTVLRRGDAVLGGFDSPFDEWLVVCSDEVEAARKDVAGTVPLLLLTPVLTKKRYKDGKPAIDEASKRAAFKWERLHVPLPDLTPLGYEYLREHWETKK